MPDSGKHERIVNLVARLKLCAWLSLLLVALIPIVSCTQEAEKQPYLATELRIGVLPDEDPDVLKSRYTPLIDYLSENLGMQCVLVIPESYDHLLELFHRREIDLAYFGAYTFIKAKATDQAVALVMRPIDKRFTSVFLVSGDSAAGTLADLQGGTFSFGSRLSTSGHLMPRYFLRQQDLVPENFFGDVRYSGAHDTTAYWVRDGIVDAGVANAAIIRSMLRRNLLAETDIRILWETPPYADYVWAVHPKVGQETVTSLLTAFLLLTPEDTRHYEILRKLDATGFVPADPADFVSLESIVRQVDGSPAIRPNR